MKAVGEASGTARNGPSFVAEAPPVLVRAGAEAAGHGAKAPRRADEGTAQCRTRESAGVHRTSASRAEAPARHGN